MEDFNYMKELENILGFIILKDGIQAKTITPQKKYFNPSNLIIKNKPKFEFSLS
jgi:hypothetical protein